MPRQQLSYYQGRYTVELQPGAAKDHLPTGSVNVSGNTVSVLRGTVQQVMGGIQFYADGKPFSWGYKFIRRIKDANGEVLWQNWDVKD
ncbi:MAG: hypothetical protein AAB799_02665 [Patescibacteria group bacterium]